MNQARIELISAESSAERKKSICESILKDLPGWFGIEEATQAYIAGVADKSMVVAADGDDIVGFLSLVHHNQYTSEIYVLGVKKAFQRQGIGAQLPISAERYPKERKTQWACPWHGSAEFKVLHSGDPSLFIRRCVTCMRGETFADSGMRSVRRKSGAREVGEEESNNVGVCS